LRNRVGCKIKVLGDTIQTETNPIYIVVGSYQQDKRLEHTIEHFIETLHEKLNEATQGLTLNTKRYWSSLYEKTAKKEGVHVVKFK
jgi:hypothetical protein